MLIVSILWTSKVWSLDYTHTELYLFTLLGVLLLMLVLTLWPYYLTNKAFLAPSIAVGEF
jgi:hypothetical protein